MKFQTFLPIFSGFYNTIWEPDTSDYEYETGLEYGDEFDFDNTKYETDVATDLCYKLAEQFPDIFKRIVFERVHSPREYNFGNDVIYCTIQLNAGHIRGIIKAHPDQFEQYLKENFTSCPGFSSYYSNDPQVWLNKMKRFRDLDSTEIGSILEIACLIAYREQEEDDTKSAQDLSMHLYYEVMEHIYINDYCTEKEREESDSESRYRSLKDFVHNLHFNYCAFDMPETWDHALDAWFECLGRLHAKGQKIPPEYEYVPAKRIEGTLHEDSDYHKPFQDTEPDILLRIAAYLTRLLRLLERKGYKPLS